MLLRQLHRPLLRSVAAAWRPATTPALLFHHGDSRCSSKPSLWEELFPDEAKKSQAKLGKKDEDDNDLDVPSNTWISRLFKEEEEPPRLDVPKELQDIEDEHGSLERDAPSEFYAQALRAKSMLILKAASKNLLESDFLRLGTKGKHVEGWVGGILKVIQARDPDSLEPKGDYFILFDSHEAALAYEDKLEQLWKLGKTYVPGAHHKHYHTIQQPLPKGLRYTTQGDDVAKLISSFTLVPPSQRRHVQLSRMSPSKIVELDLEGGFVDQLAAVTASKFLVMIRLEGGRLSLDTLRRAIEDDGIQRNLPWRITDLNHGILPFGKSILKTQDKVPIDAANGPLDEEGWSEISGDEGDAESGVDSSKSKDLVVYDTEEMNEGYRQYPRFIIPFLDQAEAHRFVRNWHRRELTLRMGGGSAAEPSWEENRVINATILW